MSPKYKVGQVFEIEFDDSVYFYEVEHVSRYPFGNNCSYEYFMKATHKNKITKNTEVYYTIANEEKLDKYKLLA